MEILHVSNEHEHLQTKTQERQRIHKLLQQHKIKTEDIQTDVLDDEIVLYVPEHDVRICVWLNKPFSGGET